MKQIHAIYRYMLAFMLVMTASQTMQAQEAFYIYRNDGEFNGFFYDEVLRIGVSKVDFNGVEHEEYVMQEIQTTDTLYRIPLAAIDSIGFQQPEIIISDKLCKINDVDSPVQIYWEFFSSDDGYTITCTSDAESMLPVVGQILYRDNWVSYSGQKGDGIQAFDKGPFIGKVVEVRKSTYDFPYPNDYVKWYDIVCEPITDLSEIFEQLITVEQIGTDESGNARRRIAGADNVQRRVEGNTDMTLVNLSGRFPFARGNDDFEVSMSLDLSLQVRANVSYCISSRVTYIGLTLKEDAEVGVNFTAKANLGEITTWHLAGVPVYFPAILPIFQVDPSPQAFIKTTGDLSLNVASPKFAYHGIQNFHLGTDHVGGNCINMPTKPGDEDNDWQLTLSLNGSIQGGSNFPMKLETNRWAEKALHASIGADVYVGPKISASFVVDPIALASGDGYNSLKNSQIALSPVNSTFEANATYSFKGKPDEKVKFFEGSKDYFTFKLLLFPEFEDIQITKEVVDNTQEGSMSAKIFPRGLSVPYYVGLGLYKPGADGKMKLIKRRYGDKMYGFLDTFAEQENSIDLLDGTYTICPVISAFSLDVPVWEKKKEVKRSLIPSWRKDGFEKETTDGVGYVYVSGILPDDEVEFELYEKDSKTVHMVTKDVYDWGPGDDKVLCHYPQLTTGTHDEEPCPLKVTFELDKSEEVAVSHSVGDEKAYRYRYKFKNNLEKYDLYDHAPITGPCTQTWTHHREENTIRVKVTRADGRILYSSFLYFSGHGKDQDPNTGEITIK